MIRNDTMNKSSLKTWNKSNPGEFLPAKICTNMWQLVTAANVYPNVLSNTGWDKQVLFLYKNNAMYHRSDKIDYVQMD